MKKIKFLTLVVLILIGCSKDDSSSSQEQNIEGGIITKYQVVTQELQNVTEETYQAEINGTSIDVVKSGQNTISFLVDDNFDLGESVLEIPDLNTKINYTVENTILQSSVDNTITSLTSIFDGFASSLESTNTEHVYVTNTINNFHEVIEQLSDADKEKIALVYQANQSYFNNLYQTDYTQPLGRVMTSDYSNLTFPQLTINWAAATFAAGTSTFLAVAASAQPLLAIPLGLAAITLWSISHDIWKEGFSRAEVVYQSCEFGDFTSLFDTRINNSIELNSGVPMSFDFNINSRGVEASDENNSNSILVSFFNTLTDFNKIIDKINGVINIVNNVPFTNITLLDNVALGNAPEETFNANQDIFSNFQFNLTHNNLELSTPTLTNGNINFTVTILDETQVTDFVEANITYSYQDELNTFTGSIPVKVFLQNQTDLIGNWYVGTYTLDHWGDISTNTLYNCGSQYGEIGEVYIFIGNTTQENQIIVYYKSIINSLPNIYKKPSYTTYDFNSPSSSFYHDFRPLWQENLGEDPNSPGEYLYRDFSLDWLHLSEDESFITHSQYWDGSAIYRIPSGTGIEDCNGDYEYFYSINNVYLTLIGSNPPNNLSNAEIERFETLLTDDNINEIITE